MAVTLGLYPRTMATAPDGRLLERGRVQLRRAHDDDLPALFAALDDERVWQGGYGGGPAGRAGDVEALRAMIDVQAALPGQVVYVVLLDGEVVGTTSLGDVSEVNEQLHIGWTAYAPAVWAGVVNPSAKLLLFAHAFDDLGMGRVRLQADHRNSRSLAAIERLGAVREGVLRRDRRRADGTFRDTVVFSVLREEWPEVRAGLLRRLSIL